MREERLDGILNLYRNYEDVEDLDSMVAELRRNFLDYEVVNKKHNHDISNELACGPDHVLYYLAEYIDILEKQNKRYLEGLTKARNHLLWLNPETGANFAFLDIEEALKE